MSGWYYFLLGGLARDRLGYLSQGAPVVDPPRQHWSRSRKRVLPLRCPGNDAIGTVYAVWTGIGAAGSALVGIGLFGESASAFRLGLIALVTVVLIGIGFSSRWAASAG
jgi:hypothetical protein